MTDQSKNETHKVDVPCVCLDDGLRARGVSGLHTEFQKLVAAQRETYEKFLKSNALTTSRRILEESLRSELFRISHDNCAKLPESDVTETSTPTLPFGLGSMHICLFDNMTPADNDQMLYGCHDDASSSTISDASLNTSIPPYSERAQAELANYFTEPYIKDFYESHEREKHIEPAEVDNTLEFRNGYETIPENGVWLNCKSPQNPPGLTGLYRKLRECHFKDKKRGKERVVGNDWINAEIVQQIMERSQFDNVRFFSYVKTKKIYEELLGEKMYEAIKKSIDDYKPKEKSIKKISSEILSTVPFTNVVQTSAAPLTLSKLSDWMKAKRTVLRRMKEDAAKVSVYQGIIDNVSDALIDQTLNAGSTMEELHSWMVHTWNIFFGNDMFKKRDLLSMGIDHVNNVSLSFDNFKTDISVNFKRRRTGGTERFKSGSFLQGLEFTPFG